MNEVVKELVANAWDRACMEASLLDSQGAEPGDFFAQILIDLVIRECVVQIDNECHAQFNDRVITNLGGLNQAKYLIAEHFGVQ